MTRQRCAVITVLLLSAACSDMQESRYPSLADAKRDGAIARGWLPDVLPPSAQNIREIHNIDTNQMWCAFEFSRSEANAFRAAVVPLNPSDLEGRDVRRPGVAWWPEVLEGRLDSAAIARAGLELYLRESVLFFIDWRGHAFLYDE